MEPARGPSDEEEAEWLQALRERYGPSGVRRARAVRPPGKGWTAPNIARALDACHRSLSRWTLPRPDISVAGEYSPTARCEPTPEGLHQNVPAGSRMAAERSADAVKAFNREPFEAATSSHPVPVLGLEAEKLPGMISRGAIPWTAM